jgi:type II secretory pathway pseudopilin PulG
MVLHDQGFTIVEVSLFLAISGLLVLIALIGTGSSIQTTRFSDTGRSTHAYLQKQYDNLLNGVNSRPGQEQCSGSIVDSTSNQSPGTSNCLLLGKAMRIKTGGSNITTYDIVGTEPATPNYDLPDTDLIQTFKPTIVRSVGADTFQMPWLATVIGGKRAPAPTSDGLPADMFAIIRSPRSTHIVSYTFQEASLLGSNDMTPIVSNRVNTEQLTSFCIKSADNANSIAKFVITGMQGQDAIQLVFGAVAGDCL